MFTYSFWWRGVFMWICIWVWVAHFLQSTFLATRKLIWWLVKMTNQRWTFIILQWFYNDFMVGKLIANSANTTWWDPLNILCVYVGCIVHWYAHAVVRCAVCFMHTCQASKHTNNHTQTVFTHSLFARRLFFWFCSFLFVVLCCRISGSVVNFFPYLWVCVFFVCVLRCRRRCHSRFFNSITHTHTHSASKKIHRKTPIF